MPRRVVPEKGQEAEREPVGLPRPVDELMHRPEDLLEPLGPGGPLAGQVAQRRYPPDRDVLALDRDRQQLAEADVGVPAVVGQPG
nr:hypothetical protein GCM10020092_040160 [Actinoplanes digitatis]